MTEPLFPIKPLATEPGNAILTIEPYRHDGAWVFDEPRVGLHREPFVSGIIEMIDRLVVGIPDAAQGFRLRFAARVEHHSRMALSKCPDCSNEVSTLAAACPKCGRPMKQPIILSESATSPQKTTSTVGSGVKIGFGMFVVLPLLLAFGGCAACAVMLGAMHH